MKTNKEKFKFKYVVKSNSGKIFISKEYTLQEIENCCDIIDMIWHDQAECGCNSGLCEKYYLCSHPRLNCGNNIYIEENETIKIFNRLLQTEENNKKEIYSYFNEYKCDNEMFISTSKEIKTFLDCYFNSVKKEMLRKEVFNKESIIKINLANENK